MGAETWLDMLRQFERDHRMDVSLSVDRGGLNHGRHLGGLLANIPLDRMLHQFARTAERQFLLNMGLIGLYCFHADV